MLYYRSKVLLHQDLMGTKGWIDPFYIHNLPSNRLLVLLQDFKQSILFFLRQPNRNDNGQMSLTLQESILQMIWELLKLNRRWILNRRACFRLSHAIHNLKYLRTRGRCVTYQTGYLLNHSVHTR
ncbi:hypothetical protein HanRHA438_Chr12g0558561 [Helianthus annuus]|nr:hypothetical protein HanRHA438_Chr12g0558561 [Helianthus annuus]